MQNFKAQSVVEVLAESAFGNFRFEIGICGGNNAHVDKDGCRTAHALDFAVFYGAQYVLLKFGGGVANFIEEEGAATRGFKFARAGFCRARISPFFVSKEFAFEQLVGNGGAVDFDKGTVFAVTAIVDGSGDEFFARSGFARDERGSGDGGYGLRSLEDLLEFGTGSDDLIAFAKFVSVELVFAPQILNFSPQLGVFLECLIHAVEFFKAEFDFVFDIKVFFNKVCCAQSQCSYGSIYCALSGEHNDGQVGNRCEHLW